MSLLRVLTNRSWAGAGRSQFPHLRAGLSCHSTRAESLPGWGPRKQLAQSLTESPCKWRTTWSGKHYPGTADLCPCGPLISLQLVGTMKNISKNTKIPQALTAGNVARQFKDRLLDGKRPASVVTLLILSVLLIRVCQRHKHAQMREGRIGQPH